MPRGATACKQFRTASREPSQASMCQACAQTPRLGGWPASPTRAPMAPEITPILTTRPTGLHRAPWMAGIAQLVERQVVVLDVTGSSPVARPIPSAACTRPHRRIEPPLVLAGGQARAMGGGDKTLLRFAARADAGVDHRGAWTCPTSPSAPTATRPGLPPSDCRCCPMGRLRAGAAGGRAGGTANGPPRLA